MHRIQAPDGDAAADAAGTLTVMLAGPDPVATDTCFASIVLPVDYHEEPAKKEKY